jgi:hypothetical protein
MKEVIMRQELKNIYEDLFVHFFDPRYFKLFGQKFRQNIQSYIKEEVDTFEEEHTNKIRPDGKYFLLVNFHHMFTMALTHPDMYQRVPDSTIENCIKKDVNLILDYTHDENNADREITSGDLLKSTGKLWEKLSINKTSFWGCEEEWD